MRRGLTMGDACARLCQYRKNEKGVLVKGAAEIQNLLKLVHPEGMRQLRFPGGEPVYLFATPFTTTLLSMLR